MKNKEIYPPFQSEIYFDSENRKSWKSAARKRYFDWYMSIKDQRLEYLLKYLEIDLLSQATVTLDAAGQRAVPLLKHEIYSSPNERGYKELTSHGLGLAADLGFLLAYYLIKDARSEISWGILRDYHRDQSYNLPVLLGFRNIHLDPILGSINVTKSILNHGRQSTRWREAYQYWMENNQI